MSQKTFKNISFISLLLYLKKTKWLTLLCSGVKAHLNSGGANKPALFCLKTWSFIFKWILWSSCSWNGAGSSREEVMMCPKCRNLQTYMVPENILVLSLHLSHDHWTTCCLACCLMRPCDIAITSSSCCPGNSCESKANQMKLWIFLYWPPNQNMSSTLF